ncbi:hypothetical protein ACIQUS_19025 [Pseudomonas sp. NPDC090755]|uniref:hypothetical protein n=1 Tax=Pseudomonas sp. NPDC090755 TaxID=3364481 RepID=UPI00383B2278
MQKTIIAMLLGVLSATSVQAQTCPAVSSISQTPKDVGFLYKAPGGWEGESPNADEGDVKTFNFANALIKPNAVVCGYNGDNKSVVELTLEKAVTAAEDFHWQDGTCEGSDPAKCAFN